MKILALGDSITNGYDGERDLTNGTYPQELSKLLNCEVTNYGVNNAMITRHEYGDLTPRVNSVDFTKYDLIIIFYGTNDYAHMSSSLTDVENELGHAVEAIKAKNPKATLLGIVPMNRWDFNHNADQIVRGGGYTFHQLQAGIAKTYAEHEVACLDWNKVAPRLLTDDNYQERLHDSHLHPNAKMYGIMADYIAKFIREHHLI
ncbi:SGNH/GDSL hydrolase family protein [Nicoliella spurrieriana]|uniref:SGNH/GDSL hydrolase family protein n=1 Tax=Nicoliella spurrieriana TaxID=2925830 RepID=A0A976RSM3_9LACO|nr:SGNH/GDSL hydrolase family protein [Nicoliella spurrieriana]UQS87108.1 SGNH/GDSL hydrolase family protein [Nicoliella spurrieriana]